MLDEPTTKRLRRAIKAWGEANEPLNAAQDRACFEAVEFLRHARITKCFAHVTTVDMRDGKVVTSYHKARMSARLKDPGRTVRRTVAMTTSPFAQVLKAFATFEWAKVARLSAALKDLIPGEQWASLASQLAVKRGELEQDPARQAALEVKLEEARGKIFEKERQDLLHEMERLIRRGWTEDQVMEVWNEAVVKDVMES